MLNDHDLLPEEQSNPGLIQELRATCCLRQEEQQALVRVHERLAYSSQPLPPLDAVRIDDLALARQRVTPAAPPTRISRFRRGWLTRLGTFAAAMLVIVLVGSLALTFSLIQHTGVGSPPSITTFNVQRTAAYADLNFTVLNAQYATSFPDDTIHPGPAVVRVNLHVTNKTPYQITVSYYGVARLLGPKLSPATPTNVHLSANPKPSSGETGWIDFPVAKGTQLGSLKLQLGSVSLGETLVTIPFSGSFNPGLYADKLSQQSLTISYDFSGNTLNYHLQSVDIRYSYQGTQCKAGNQYYVLNFTVDNPNGADVNPGFGFDYIRLIINGYNRPPIDNTLPYGFKAGARSVGGRVVFIAPAGLTTLDIAFLLQLVVGQDNYQVTV